MVTFKVKKKLGQHFLKDKTILEKICSLRTIRNKSVVEIGPGFGHLTKYILEKKPDELLAIEKDKTLDPHLKKIQRKHPKNFRILYEDALSINLSKLLKKKYYLYLTFHTT